MFYTTYKLQSDLQSHSFLPFLNAIFAVLAATFLSLLNWGCEIVLHFGNLLSPDGVSCKLKYKMRRAEIGMMH
jgi:hypothetical protein